METKKKTSLGERKRKRKEREENKQLLLIVGDALVTCIWVLLSATFAEAAEVLAGISGLQEFALAVAVTITAIMAMGPMCDMFGGALFNPIHNAAFWCAGKGTLAMNLVRVAAQIVGALGGSYLAVAIIPESLKEHFPKLPGGLKEGVQLELGVAVEMLLGMVLNMVVLHAMDTKNKLVAYWSPIIATVALIVTGSYFTGPSMNPAIAFSWYHHYAGHSWTEQVLVYWLAPFAGAMLGGLLYRRLSPGEVAAPKSQRQLPAALKAAAGVKED